MTSLRSQQLNCLRQHLRAINPQDLLLDELVDYLASQIEELMHEGTSFEKALSIVCQETNSLSIRHLHRTLIRQNASTHTEFWRNAYQSLSQVNAAQGFTQSVRNTLFIGSLLNIMLTALLLVGKGFAVPAELVATLLCPLVLLLFLQLFCSARIHRSAVPGRWSTSRLRLSSQTTGRRNNLTGRMH